ncbi:aminoglycoside phosphotransferase family protein [Vibrio sp. RC27]
MEELTGGRVGQVFFSDDKVIRPSGSWSQTVHALLDYLRSHNFNAAPISFGFDERKNEILSFVTGEVCNYPLNDAFSSDEALQSAARLLRQYHDVTVGFVETTRDEHFNWMLPAREPQEVICHGDFAPYNVAIKDKRVVGVFDFDTAHPAPRIWDIAYAIYSWAPFKTNPDDRLGDIVQQSNRAKQFCDAYGLSGVARVQLVDTMVTRIETLTNFMQTEANNGNETFIANLKDGHHLSYHADMEYIERHRHIITDRVTAPSISSHATLRPSASDS